MKKRTMALVAGMVLLAASAGFSQAAETKKGIDNSKSSILIQSIQEEKTGAKQEYPDILNAMNEDSAYKSISNEDMSDIYGAGRRCVVIVFPIVMVYCR